MNTTTKTIRSTLLAAGLAAAASVSAEALRFDFKDPKGVNNIVFLLDAPLESINGTATGISGEIAYDPGNPAATTGSIRVEAASLHVGNPKMKEHLHGAKWLDVREHKEIVFELISLEGVRREGDRVEATARGKLTILGTTREVSAPVSIDYLEGRLGQRLSGAEGDLLVARSNFSIRRSDFGINPGDMEEKVSDRIDLRLSLAGMAPR